jgi:hypothetical protein
MTDQTEKYSLDRESGELGMDVKRKTASAALLVTETSKENYHHEQTQKDINGDLCFRNRAECGRSNASVG